MPDRQPSFVRRCAILVVLATGAACTPSGNDGAGDAPRRAFLAPGEKIAEVVPVENLQFDLVCHTTRQFDLRDPVRPNGARPYRSPNRRNDILRKVIDLEKMEYCYSQHCGMRKRDPIAGVTPEGIIFEQHPDLVQFYRWDSGLSESRFTYGGRTSIQQGQCRMEAFSGFPARQPRLIPVREADGAGPHPFVHEGPHPDDEPVAVATGEAGS